MTDQHAETVVVCSCCLRRIASIEISIAPGLEKEIDPDWLRQRRVDEILRNCVLNDGDVCA